MSLRTKRNALLLLLALLAPPQLAAAQGIVLSGVGPINRSMGGAATAAPLDAAGAIHWNPASLSGLCGSQVVLGADFLYRSTELASVAPVGAGSSLAGSTRSDTGVDVLPTIAVAWQPCDSRWTYGLGVFTVGRIGENYPADDPSNPSNTVLQPPPFGLGPVYSKLSVTQVVPSIAFEVSERLSVGLAPTISIADAAFDPYLYATPDASNAYPPATHTRLYWGLGFQAGVYWELDAGWRLGASYKSPQWFESFDFSSIDTLGVPQQLSMNMDYPGISSIGVSYAGLPRWVWAMDLRYIDYDNAEGFGHDAALDPTGRVTGLGWRSVFSVATGLQYELIDCLTLRAGYVYTENPIRDEATFFNVPTTAIYEHVGSIGATWQVSHRTSLSLTYVHAFENTIGGPIPPSVAAGAGSTVSATQSADALTAGLEVRF